MTADWMSDSLRAEVGRVAGVIASQKVNEAERSRQARARSWLSLRSAALEQLEPEVRPYADLPEEAPDGFRHLDDFYEVAVRLPGAERVLTARFAHVAGTWARSDYGFAAWDDPDVSVQRGGRWLARADGRDHRSVRSLGAAVYWAYRPADAE